MTILAEIVRRLDGRRFETYVRDEVFRPLGMDDCWVGMPADAAAGYGARIGTMHGTSTDVAVPLVDVRRARLPRAVHPRRWWPRSVAPARPTLRSAPAPG